MLTIVIYLIMPIIIVNKPIKKMIEISIINTHSAII